MKLLQIFILLLLLSAKTAGFSQDTCFVKGFTLGETTVSVEQKRFNGGSSNVLFINLHDNETTSGTAAAEYLIQHGGTLVRLYNNGLRFIKFKLKGKTYYFDPNRIYSEPGRISSLTKLSARFTAAAETEVAYLADQLLTNYIDSSKLIIALHNNTDSNLSVLTYEKEQLDSLHSGKVFISPYMDPDDFVLTTDPTIFARLKEKNINAVWENVDSVKDDGSLSVYAGRNKIAYVNVEAEHGHADEQCYMLLALHEIIEEHKNKEKSDRNQPVIELSPTGDRPAPNP